MLVGSFVLSLLAGVLSAVGNSLGIDSPLHEALRKAGVALTLGFLRGMRVEIETQFSELGAELSDMPRVQLRRMGLHPDT